MQRKELIILILMKFLAVSLTQSTTTDFYCGPNTVQISGCVGICPPTCAVPEPKICPLVCRLNGCVCIDGFIRSVDANSLCIPKSRCPKPPKPCNNGTRNVTCGRNEVYSDCWNTCVETCNRRGIIECPLEKCGTEGCFCAEGYIRRDSGENNSPCIHISDCPCN